jgi:hypothetical protein
MSYLRVKRFLSPVSNAVHGLRKLLAGRLRGGKGAWDLPHERPALGMLLILLICYSYFINTALPSGKHIFGLASPV